MGGWTITSSKCKRSFGGLSALYVRTYQYLLSDYLGGVIDRTVDLRPCWAVPIRGKRQACIGSKQPSWTSHPVFDKIFAFLRTPSSDHSFTPRLLESDKPIPKFKLQPVTVTFPQVRSGARLSLRCVAYVVGHLSPSLKPRSPQIKVHFQLQETFRLQQHDPSELSGT